MIARNFGHLLAGHDRHVATELKSVHSSASRSKTSLLDPTTALPLLCLASNPKWPDSAGYIRELT